MTRRVCRAAMAAAIWTWTGVQAQGVVDVEFVDSHVHLNDPAAWLQLMDENGIRQAVVLRGRSMDNAGLLNAAERWPGRLIPFLSVSPEHREYRASWAADDGEAGTIADSLLSAGGFRGIGEISVVHFPGAGFPEADFNPDGASMRAVMQAARRHSVPVMVHVELTRLREFQSLLDDFSDVTVLWAHGGYTPMVIAERMLTRFPNLLYELSARTWPIHPRSPEYTILRDGQNVWPGWIDLIQRLPTRFVAGTDASLRSTESDQRKIASVHRFLDQLRPDVRRMVASENLRRALGLGK